MSSRPLLVAGVLASSLLVSACGHLVGRSQNSDNLGGQLITAATIRGSGLSSGWDVLRRFAEHLTITEHGDRPLGVTQRGRQSIYLPEQPLLIVDGVKVSNFRVLASVPAREIESMRILSPLEGNIRYGIRAGSGVIIVQTLQIPPTGPEDSLPASRVRVGR